MKSLVVALVFVAGAVIAAAPASASEALLKKNNCTACHAIDKKLVGPAYKDVAKKYAGDAGAEKMLAKALMNLEIPSGGFPSAVGLAVFNVSSTAELGMLLPQSQGVIERVVTITGPGIDRPGNYLVPLGTPLRFILERLGFRGNP